MNIKAILFFLLLMPTVAIFAQRNHPDDIVGTWIVGESKARIQVYRAGNKYHGKIIWLKDPLKDGRGASNLRIESYFAVTTT